MIRPAERGTSEAGGEGISMYAASQKGTDTALHFPAKYTRFRPVRLSGTLLRAALTAAGENKAEF